MELNGKLFKNALIAGIAIITFSGCSAELSERDEILSKEYQLEEVTWIRMPGDEVTCRTFDESQEVVAERKGTGYSAIIFPLEDYIQSSQFFSDDPELFMHLVGSTSNKLFVPSEGASLSDNKMFIAGGAQVPFLLEWYGFEPNSYSPHELTAEEPFKAQGSSTIEEYQVIATYQAIFKEVNSEKKIEITGKWKGVYYRCRNSKISSLPLSVK